MSRPKYYTGLFTLQEDERINLMGQHIMESGETAGVVVDRDPPEKIARYIEKLTTRFPMVEVFERGSGPAEGMVFFKARRKGH